MTTKGIFNTLLLPAVLAWALFANTISSQAQVTQVANSIKGISGPSGLIPDNNGNLYAADWAANSIFKIALASGNVTSIINNPGSFNGPGGMAYDGSRYLYVAMSSGNAIRRVDLTNNSVTTVAGSGTAGNADGRASSAQFSYPWGLALDVAAGELYVADQDNQIIRKIALSNNMVTTIAGQPNNKGSLDGQENQARFHYPTGLALDAGGILYVADAGNNTIRKITLGNNTVTTIAGMAGSTGTQDGLGTQARFHYPAGLALHANKVLFVGDYNNERVRKIELNNNNKVTTVPGNNAGFYNPGGDIAVDAAGNVYYSAFSNSAIMRIAAATALPVQFGTVTAQIKDSRLVVAWQTLSEQENDHFEVQVSKDGKEFATAALVQTKAVNGNSDRVLNYEHTIAVSATGALSGAVLLSLLIFGFTGTKRKWLVAGHLLVIISLAGFSCTKADALDAGIEKLFVRIAQVDKDGAATYSKVVIATKDQ